MGLVRSCKSRQQVKGSQQRRLCSIRSSQGLLFLHSLSIISRTTWTFLSTMLKPALSSGQVGGL